MDIQKPATTQPQTTPIEMDPERYIVSDGSQHFPTPPHSGTPDTSSGSGRSPPQDFISVSTAFHPQARHPAPLDYEPDTIIYSSMDSVFFHVHRRQIDHPGALLLHQLTDPNNRIIVLSEYSETVNCVLHLLYNFSCKNYTPSVETYSLAFAALSRFGYNINTVISPQSTAFTELVALADSEPLAVYTLAAAHSLDEVAVQVSTAALAVPLTDIDAASASAMGAVYLLRLARLHQTRKDALKGLMLVAPKEHEDIPTCGSEARRSVMRAYALAAAYLAWEVIPNADRDWIMRGLSPLLGHVTCRLCEQNLRTRIQSVLDSWEQVKATI